MEESTNQPASTIAAPSPAAQQSVDESMMSEASPFAHIQVGRLAREQPQHGEGEEITEKSLQEPSPWQTQPLQGLRRSSLSRGSSIQESKTDNQPTMSSITMSSHDQGLTSPSMTISTSSSSDARQHVRPTSTPIASAGNGLPTPTTTPGKRVVKAVASIDWEAVSTSLHQQPPCLLLPWAKEALMQCTQQDCGSTGIALANAISRSCIEGLHRHIGTDAKENGAGVEDLKKHVEQLLSNLSSQPSKLKSIVNLIRNTISQAVQTLNGKWFAAEKQLVSMVVEKIRAEGENNRGNGQRNGDIAVDSALEQIKLLETRAQAMMSMVRSKIQRCKRHKANLIR